MTGTTEAATSTPRRLQVHTSERADVLLDALAQVLATDPPADPFAPEIVAVPTRGVERWVAQRLSHRLGALLDRPTGASADESRDPSTGEAADRATGPSTREAGVCANVVFDPPARIVHRAVAAASGIDPDDDPWQSERLAWHVVRASDAAIAAGATWAAPLTRYLVDVPGAPGAADEVRAGRRMRLAQSVAGRFAAYASQRPSLVTAWADGRDEDGFGAALPDDLVWQAHLWRAVRESVGVPDPAERLAAATAALRDDPALVDLPPRLSVFGPTRLPQAHLDVLDALAAHRAVHLWLPYPSEVLWHRAATNLAAHDEPRAPGDDAHVTAPRRRVDVPVLAQHPLLGSLGQDSIELGLRLAALRADVTHHAAPAPPATILGRLQASLRSDERATAGIQTTAAAAATDEPAVARGADKHLDGWSARSVADLSDRSVQVHACHGRSRQVEVLREVVVGLLAADPTLEPRDVVVMCPDVEAFAPLVVATFGAPGDLSGDATLQPHASSGPGRPTHPGRTLRVRVADRSPARTNPVLRVVGDLLELAGSRVTASGVVDFAGLEAVRRRFGFDDSALERLRAWTLASGVRWGEDQERRRAYGLGHVGQGTWEAASDRLLLGVAMADEDDRFLGATIPLDDVGSTDVDLAGRFAELVDRLTGLLAELGGERPASAWFDTLDRALTLLAEVAPADQWQRVEARAVLTDARVSAAGTAGAGGSASGSPAFGASGTTLRLPDVVALLAPRLAGRPTRAGFRTGALTVCSLEPMRAVPHRVVCLLGMDDGVFPRAGSRSGDDVLARDPRVGERDRRAEDRQLFLDAVTSAGEHLIVVHSGADERTGRPMPPAVPVGELLDALDDAAGFAPDPRTGAPRTAREAIVVHHPLQAVDERNFTAGTLGAPGPFSFDAVARRAAIVGRAPRSAPDHLLDAPLDPATDLVSELAAGTTLDLDALISALEHPTRTFVRRRLGVVLPRDAQDVDDRLPLAADPLAAWASGERLLAALLDGDDPQRAFDAERRRGSMPPGALGGAALSTVGERASAVALATEPFTKQPAVALDVTVPLPDGRTLTGTVAGVRGGCVLRATYSRLAPKHRLRAWVQVLALSASSTTSAGGGWSATTVGRGPGSRPTAAFRTVTAPPPAEARQLLAALVQLHDQVLREPLPLPVGPAESYASARAGHASPEVALEQAQRTLADAFDEDDYDVLAWGAGFTIAQIAGRPVPPEAAAASASAAANAREQTRFGTLARIVWEPLLARETGGVA